jgi:hypothetical protein
LFNAKTEGRKSRDTVPLKDELVHGFCSSAKSAKDLGEINQLHTRVLSFIGRFLL